MEVVELPGSVVVDARHAFFLKSDHARRHGQSDPVLETGASRAMAGSSFDDENRPSDSCRAGTLPGAIEFIAVFLALSATHQASSFLKPALCPLNSVLFDWLPSVSNHFTNRLCWCPLSFL